jgi:hypothetical protein
MEDKDLGNNRTDYLAAIGRSIVGWAPFIGPVLSEAVTISIPGQRLDRIQHFVFESDAGLKHLTEGELQYRVQKCLPLIEEGFAKAARAATAERRLRIADFVSKGITATMLSENQLLFLLDILDQVNDAEIVLLGISFSRTLQRNRCTSRNMPKCYTSSSFTIAQIKETLTPETHF